MSKQTTSKQNTKQNTKHGPTTCSCEIGTPGYMICPHRALNRAEENCRFCTRGLIPRRCLHPEYHRNRIHELKSVFYTKECKHRVRCNNQQKIVGFCVVRGHILTFSHCPDIHAEDASGYVNEIYDNDVEITIFQDGTRYSLDAISDIVSVVRMNGHSVSMINGEKIVDAVLKNTQKIPTSVKVLSNAKPPQSPQPPQQKDKFAMLISEFNGIYKKIFDYKLGKKKSDVNIAELYLFFEDSENKYKSLIQVIEHYDSLKEKKDLLDKEILEINNKIASGLLKELQ